MMKPITRRERGKTNNMQKYAIRRLLFKAGSRFTRKREEARLAGCPDVLFIWIPKTAGSSIFSLLGKMGMGKYKSLDQARYLFPDSGMATLVHQSVASLVEMGAVQEAFVRSAFKFSFVRNPYDRAVSLYYYFRRFGRISPDVSFGRFLEILAEEWDKNRNLKVPVEADLSARVCYRGEFISPDEHTLYPVGPYNVLGWSQCRPQADWLTSAGGLDKIHLGRMENINEDCEIILGEIFGACEKRHREALEIYGGSVPKINTTPHRDYREYFEDPALRRIVEEIYRIDFESFNY
jgi:hypothetical protein